MAQKQKQRPSPLDDPPTASSSDSEEVEDRQPSPQHHDADEEEEEEEVASSEEASSEEEEDQPPTTLQPPSKTLPPPPSNSHSHPKPSSSESETETESDSRSYTDPDPDPDSDPPKVKPLASKPMDQAQKPRAQPKSGSKRAVENNAHASDSKRAKKKVTDSPASAPPSDEDDVKKKSQRLWSDDDQLAILKGMVEFTSNTGQDPFKHANAFHDFIKKSLHVEVSSNQLKEKIRRLKKKFEINADKLKNGEDLKFPKSHDQKAFELSKKVWGSEQQVPNGAVEKAKSNGKIAKTPQKEGGGSRTVASAKKLKPEAKPEPEVVSVDVKEYAKVSVDGSLVLSEMSRFQSLHGLNEEEVKRGLELMGESKRAELEGKWKKLRVAETELFANRAILTGEQTKLILEALRSSNH